MHLVGNDPFSFNIASIFHFHLCRLDDFLTSVGDGIEECGEGGNKTSKCVECDLRTADQVDGLASCTKGCGAQRFQLTVDVLGLHGRLLTESDNLLNLVFLLNPTIQSVSFRNP